MNIALLLRLAPWALFALAIGWAVWERDGWQGAERRLVELKNEHLLEANTAWGKVERAREAFDAEIAKGLAVYNQKVRELDVLNDSYAKAVRADVASKISLTPAQRAALRLLEQPAAADAPAGNTVRPADPRSSVR